VFDPTPQHPAVPWTYLVEVLVIAIGSTLVAAVAAIRAARTPGVDLLRTVRPSPVPQPAAAATGRLNRPRIIIAVKRYEVSYANKVLVALAALQEDGVVEKSVRQLATESGVSASAVQIGLTALRKAGRVRTARKGAAGRPSVIELLSVEPLADENERRPVYGADGHLADAFVERYDAMLRELDRRRDRDGLSELRERVGQLEAENADLRATIARLAALVGNEATAEKA